MLACHQTRLLQNLTLKNPRSESQVKGQRHIVHPVSNRCISFSFNVSRTNHSSDMAKSLWTWQNTSEILKNKFAKKSFLKNCSKNLIWWWAWLGDVATKFCSDWMSGSHFTVQTSKFLLINVTTVNLSQGQGHLPRHKSRVTSCENSNTMYIGNRNICLLFFKIQKSTR